MITVTGFWKGEAWRFEKRFKELDSRHKKVMENKAKHLNKMKQACHDKLAAQNEYIHDLEQAVLMYRKLQKEQYNIRRI